MRRPEERPLPQRRSPSPRESRPGPHTTWSCLRASSLFLGLLVGILPAGAVQASGSGLTLQQAVRTSLERNERARISRARRDAAEARVSGARSLFYPDLSLVGNYTRRAYQTLQTVRGETSVFQHFNALNPTATITQNIYNARSFPLYRQVRKEEEAARLSSTNDLRILAFDAAEAFLNALSAEQVFQASQRRLDYARKNLGDARARFEAQIAGSNDVTRAELELATAERERTGAQGGAQIARLRLGYLMDTEVREDLEPPDGLLQTAAAPPGDENSLVSAAKTQRPDLEAGRRQAEAARASALEPLLRFVPSLAVTGLYRATNETGVTGHRHDGNATLSLGWHLFDGGKARADRAERLALARNADLDLEAAERRVALEVRTALVALGNQQATIEQASVAVSVAQQNARQTAELYRQGIANELQAADANVRLFEAEVAHVRARYGLALAYLDLRAARGLDPIGEESTP